MNYYSIEMIVPGPYVGCCPVCEEDGFPPDHPAVIVGKKASANLTAVANTVETGFDELGIKIKLAYMWPDGSLYYYAVTEKSLTKSDIPESWRDRISTITLVDPKENPHKCGCATLKEYMEC